jgi:hypothetical protein
VRARTRHTRVAISGRKALRCHASSREPGTSLTYTWRRSNGHTRLAVVGRRSRFRPGRADAGHRLTCVATASTGGGEIAAGSDSLIVAR